MNLKQMLTEMLKRKSSDLHLRVGIRPFLRTNGVLEDIDTDPMTVETMQTVVSQILNEEQQKKFNKRNELDLALSVARLGRFRINLFRQRGTTGIAIRAVNTSIPSFEELYLPDSIKDMAHLQRGLVIITGTTGSGKSTTLAAIIEEMNRNRNNNILTVEDYLPLVFIETCNTVKQRCLSRSVGSRDTENLTFFQTESDIVTRRELTKFNC